MSPHDLGNSVHAVQFDTFSLSLQTSLVGNLQDSTIVNRIRWAVRDWKKFALMVEDLKSFNDGLEAITNTITARERRPILIQAAFGSLQPNV